VTVKNTGTDGTANLVLGSTGTGNGLAAPFSVSADTCSGKTLSPAASCTITVKFSPSSTASFTDSFAIPSNDPDEASVVVSVSGQGQAAPAPDITVSDSVAPAGDLQIPFGSVAAGSSSEQTATIRNDGNADLALGALASADPVAAPFAIKTDACSNKTLAPAGSCTLTIAFAPAAAGNFTDSFDISSNDPDEAAVTVAVNGAGSATAVGDIAVTDGSGSADDLQISFGDVRGGRTMDSVVTIANAGDGALDIGTIGSENALASPFSITGDGCSNKALAAGQTCTLTVRFAAPASCSNPDESGNDDERSGGSVQRCSYNDSFNIPSNDPDEESVTFQVSGASVPGKGNVPPDRPRPRFPADGQRDLESSFMMKWDAATDPDGDPVTYEVHISRDRSFASEDIKLVETGSAAGGKTAGTLYASSGAGLLFFGFAFIGTPRGRKGLFVIAVMLTMAGTTFVACSSSDNATQQAATEVTRQVSGLQSGTTYYWKVVANDGNGGVTESDVNSFTTK
jgi:hypothetical protein